MSAERRRVSKLDVRAPGEAVPRQVAAVLAPLDRRAFGVAIGSMWGLGIFLVTTADLLLDPHPRLDLILLGQYFPGYSLSWAGALAGLAWGFLIGFCSGWLLAFTRNLVVAFWIFLVRGRHEIAATRDLLDHI